MKNFKVFIFSLIALIFLFLTFTIDWIFIAGALIFMYLNQRELFGHQ